MIDTQPKDIWFMLQGRLVSEVTSFRYSMRSSSLSSLSVIVPSVHPPLYVSLCPCVVLFVCLSPVLSLFPSCVFFTYNPLSLFICISFSFSFCISLFSVHRMLPASVLILLIRKEDWIFQILLMLDMTSSSTLSHWTHSGRFFSYERIKVFFPFFHWQFHRNNYFLHPDFIG